MGSDGYEGARTAIEDELRHALSRPLDRLLATERSLLVPAARTWDLPEGDRTALTEWGLPPLPHFTPGPRYGTEPDLVPNVAGPRERRLVRDGRMLHHLGFWGPDEDGLAVGVVPGDGRVLGLLPAPVTADDVPDALRPYCADLDEPAVSLFSSSVARYVETAWRWHAAIRILRTAEAPADTAPEVEHLRHHERLRGGVELVVDAARRLDPAVAGDDPRSVWIELIRENSA
ncbi:SUKH-4 family immunity protein [Kitasatospora sp. NPDC004240]